MAAESSAIPTAARTVYHMRESAPRRAAPGAGADGRGGRGPLISRVRWAPACRSGQACSWATWVRGLGREERGPGHPGGSRLWLGLGRGPSPRHAAPWSRKAGASRRSRTDRLRVLSTPSGMNARSPSGADTGVHTPRAQRARAGGPGLPRGREETCPRATLSCPIPLPTGPSPPARAGKRVWPLSRLRFNRTPWPRASHPQGTEQRNSEMRSWRLKVDDSHVPDKSLMVLRFQQNGRGMYSHCPGRWK